MPRRKHIPLVESRKDGAGGQLGVLFCILVFLCPLGPGDTAAPYFPHPHLQASTSFLGFDTVNESTEVAQTVKNLAAAEETWV